MRLVPWLVLAGLLAGCTFGGLAGLTSAETPSDGGLESSVIEAGATSAPDGAVDAGNDSGPDASVLLCARQNVYCNDFSGGTTEDVSPVEHVDVGSALQIDTGSLHATMIAHPESGSYGAELFRDLSPTARRAILDVDVFVVMPAWGSGGNVSMLALNVDGNPSSTEELYIAGDITSVTTSVGGTLVYNVTSSQLPTDRWVHVKLEADFTPHAGSMKISFDGMVATSRFGIDFPAASNGTLRVVLGLARNNPPTPAFDIRYDNLAIQLP